MVEAEREDWETAWSKEDVKDPISQREGKFIKI